MPQLKVQNYYEPTITAFTGALWDATFTLSVAPTYSYGYIVLAADNINLREIVYYHSTVWNVISVRAENRGLGGTTPKQHGVKELCAMKDVAEIFNFFSDNISQCFNVEKTGGLTVKVWWGTVFYNGVQVTVPDTTLILADNTTNYVKYSFPTNTISFDASNTWNIKAIISTLSGVITSITYKVAKESFIDFTVAITGALPPQAGNAGKFLQTDSTNVSWQSVVVPSASTTVAGKAEIATSAESIAWTDLGWTWANLFVLPSDIAKNIQSSTFSYWDDSGWDDTYVVALTPILTSYTTGQILTMKVTTPNTGACTVDFWPWVKSIKMPDGTDPIDWAITGTVQLRYDGTNFILISPVPNLFIPTTTPTETYLTHEVSISSINTAMDWWALAANTTGSWIPWSYNSLSNSAAWQWHAFTILPWSWSTDTYTPAQWKIIRIKNRMRFVALSTDIGWFWLTNSPSWIGIHLAHTDTFWHQCRFINNWWTLYAATSNAVSATFTNVTWSYILTDYNVYLIVFTPASQALFYINWTLVATHTTNLPTSSIWMAVWVSNNARVIKFFPPVVSVQL